MNDETKSVMNSLDKHLTVGTSIIDVFKENQHVNSETLMLLLQDLERACWQQKVELERLEEVIDKMGAVFLRIKESFSSIEETGVVSVSSKRNRDNTPTEKGDNTCQNK